jgi:hypothetical protein
MRSNANILFAVLIVLGVVSCGAPDNTAKEGNPPANTAQESGRTPRDVLPPRVGAQENTAPCPAHLIGYCRGWELYESDPALRPDPNNPNDLGHIDYCDRVVIGTKSNGTNPDLWLFARPPQPVDCLGRTPPRGPADRWVDNKVRLYEIPKPDGTHDCLAGKIRMPDHSNSNGPHEWHQITLRLEAVEGSEIGNENKLEMCFNIADDGSPPTTCETESCEDQDHPLLHGGTAHAQD